MGIITRATEKIVGLLEDAIERLGDPHGSQVMEAALRKARDRGAELAIENARLQDEIEKLVSVLDAIQDRQTVLYKEEVAAIRDVMGLGTNHNAAVLEHMLYRTKHDMRTFEQAHQYFHAVVMGRTFDPENCAADDECDK